MQMRCCFSRLSSGSLALRKSGLLAIEEKPRIALMTDPIYGKEPVPEQLIETNRQLAAKVADSEAVIDLLTAELRDVQHQLEEGRLVYADLYDFAPVGFLTLSSVGIIQESNATFAAMMGVDQRRLHNLPFNMFLASPDDLNLFLEHLRRCRSEEGKINTELRLKHGSGACVDVQLSSIPSADYARRSVVYRTAVLDVTERKQAEKASEESRRQLQLIMDAAPVPIGYLDSELRFVFVNDEYLRKFHLLRREVLGRYFRDVHGTASDDLFAGRFEKGVAGLPTEFESEVTCHHTGETYFLRVNIAPDCTPDSTPCGIVIVATDLTDQKRILEEAREAKVTADKANNAKSQFLSNMSHELRTPMNGVLGTLQLVLNGYAEPLEPKQREFLTKAYNSGKSLLRVLNDLLDMSRIETGSLSIERNHMLIRQCIQEAVDFFDSQVQEKDIRLTCSIADDIPLRVWGDCVRLQQVLINLIGNAVKFTERGEVAVEVFRGPGTTPGWVEANFKISDTGIGIPSNKRDLLFRPLSQIDESHTRRYGGIGSGLSISEKIIRMMGGTTINLESSEGEGSSFSFSLPFCEVEAAVDREQELLSPERGPAVVPASQSESKARILVAEDDALAAEILGKVLEGEGYMCDLVHDGQEAIRKWESSSYSLIIMDVQMPKMDGLSATGIIREKEKTMGKHTPILAITAFANKEDEENCLENGMDGFLSKPLDLKKGLEVITALARR